MNANQKRTRKLAKKFAREDQERIGRVNAVATNGLTYVREIAVKHMPRLSRKAKVGGPNKARAIMTAAAQ